MKLPTERQAKGYDVLVWIDEEGDVVCRAYTDEGTDFLRGMDNRYVRGDVLEIISHPDEFKKHIPPKLKVGSIAPRSRKVTPLVHSMLQ